MSEEHAFGHTITDLIIEFENVTKEELWDLYKLTKKKLDQEIKDHKDTKLAYDVLKDELKAERLAHEETKKRLEELESWVLTVVGGMLPHGVWFGTPLQKAIQNAEARKGEAMG